MNINNIKTGNLVKINGIAYFFPKEPIGIIVNVVKHSDVSLPCIDYIKVYCFSRNKYYNLHSSYEYEIIDYDNIS